MSEGPRIPLARIRPIAEEMAGHLAPFCERIEIAGSIRRQSADAGDIEFVAIPKIGRRTQPGQMSLFDRSPGSTGETYSLLWDELDRLKVTYRKRGDIVRAFTWRDLPVEVHTCERGNWGWILLHQTGPAAFRAQVGTLLVRRGYAAVDGWIHRVSGAAIPGTIETPEEQDVFRILGIDYLEPRDRIRLK